MRVAVLTSPTLNFWVAKSRGLPATLDRRADSSVSVPDPETGRPVPFQPCLDWSQAGPILADEWYDIETILIEWFGPQWSYQRQFQDQSLTWFMRAYVAAKFGEEVERLPLAGLDA